MKLRIRLGPPASGRTAAMVEIARRACLAKQRVWWIGLPAQRAGVLRRVTEGGFTALGLEVMSTQQMYYRLLAGPSFVPLEPLVVGTDRLVRVAEALAEVGGSLPAPGEAKLFAAAIAEAKRFGLSHRDVARVAGGDVEVRRLADVYGAYQRGVTGRWDYDDVRAQAVALVEGARFRKLPGDAAEWARAALPDLLIVDGLREIGPLDLRVLVALGGLVEAHLTLPQAPTGIDPAAVELVEPESTGPAPKVQRYLAPNDVAEARYVLRSLKRDLAVGGYDKFDLAVVARPATATALLALADEYGVPLMDESPRGLADSPEGGTLIDLLELPEMPTASRLLAVPELAPLAAAALELGISGADALARLAEGLDLKGRWHYWLKRLRVGEDPVAWTRALLAEVLTLTQPSLSPGFEERVLAMAQEAARLATGDAFGIWLAALLRDTRSGGRPPGGVALLDAKLVSGRHFRKVYLLGAVDGAYRADEREDYFLSEDQRVRLATLLPPSVRLPKRFQGRDDALIAELLSRGDETVVLAPEADRDGPLVADRRLLGDDPLPLPMVPAGSLLELGGPPPYRPAFEPVALVGRAGGERDSNGAGDVRAAATTNGAARHGAPVPTRPTRPTRAVPTPTPAPVVLATSHPAAGSAAQAESWPEAGDVLHGVVRLEGVDAEYLRRYDQCGFKAWGERVLLPAAALDEGERSEDDGPGAIDDWYRLIGALTATRRWTAEGIVELGERFPDMAAWLEEHAERLAGLTWGTELTDPVTGVKARLHAGERVALGKRAPRGRPRPEKAVIYRFVEPTAEPEWRWAADKLRDRWTEYLAAGIMLEHRSQAPTLVEFVVWPLLGEPVVVDNTTGDFSFRQLSSVRAKAQAAAERFGRGEVTPSPGWACRDCGVFEICRVGQRS